MTCGPTHYAGCACHESAWAAKLAAAEDRAAEAERLLLVHTSGPVKWQAAAMAAEERARRAEEALREIRTRTRGFSIMSWEAGLNSVADLALNPPPDGEKKGGEK